MPEMPLHVAVPAIICPWSKECVGTAMAAIGGVAPSTAVWPSANLTIYVPLAIARPYPVRKLWVANGNAVNGNWNVGVYQAGATPLVIASSGTVVQAGTNIIQAVNPVGGSFILPPGSYYLALTSTSGTAAFMRGTGGTVFMQCLGLAQTAASLPATPTLASITNNYLPLFGIASARTI